MFWGRRLKISSTLCILEFAPLLEKNPGAPMTAADGTTPKTPPVRLRIKSIISSTAYKIVPIYLDSATKKYHCIYSHHHHLVRSTEEQWNIYGYSSLSSLQEKNWLQAASTKKHDQLGNTANLSPLRFASALPDCERWFFENVYSPSKHVIIDSKQKAIQTKSNNHST